MQKIELIMGIPVIVEITDKVPKGIFQEVFDHFRYVDDKFSTYKATSEISKINRGELKAKDYSRDMRLILRLAEETKKETDGYFDIVVPHKKDYIDPSGIVKGWAIYEAAQILRKRKVKNFYVEAGGDIQTSGYNKENKKWAIGIRNPFKKSEIVRVLYVSGEGVATSGNYERGAHIYNPKGLVSKDKENLDVVVSLTIIAKNIYEADRFATAAFAMGRSGIDFIERQKGLEGYMIDTKGIATMTSGFHKYTDG